MSYFTLHTTSTAELRARELNPSLWIRVNTSLHLQNRLRHTSGGCEHFFYLARRGTINKWRVTSTLLAYYLLLYIIFRS